MKNNLGIRPRGHLKVNTERTSTTSSECKPQILILALVRSDISSVRENSPDLHDIVNSQSKHIRDGTVSTTRDPTPSRPHRSSSTPYNSNIILISELVKPRKLLPSTQSNAVTNRLTTPIRNKTLGERHLGLHVMGPQCQGARCGAAARVIMSGVLDAQRHTRFVGKLEPGLDIRDLLDFDVVGRHTSLVARLPGSIDRGVRRRVPIEGTTFARPLTCPPVGLYVLVLLQE